jgi:hypothetical protein
MITNRHLVTLVTIAMRSRAGGMKRPPTRLPLPGVALIRPAQRSERCCVSCRSSAYRDSLVIAT